MVILFGFGINVDVPIDHFEIKRKETKINMM